MQPDGEMSLEGWRRSGAKLEPVPIDDMLDFVSPRLGVHFVTRDGIVEVYGPDGKLWDTPLGMIVEAQNLIDRAEDRAEEAEEKADRFEAERDRMQAERDEMQAERDAMAKKLLLLGIDPATLN